MDKPILYSRASNVQRHDAKQIITEFASFLETRACDKCALLDVGSGSGDVLMEILVPVLGKGFSRITGIDISPKMVEYASKYYASIEGVDFKELDIEGEHLPQEFQEQFDRVTSFYCLHWIKDQRKSLENIFKSLRGSGDCLLVFLGSNSVHDVYKVLSTHPRWKDYERGLDQMFSPLFGHACIGEEYEALLDEVGFTDRQVEVRKKVFAYEGLANFKSNMKAINPFGLTDSEFDEYFVDFCDCLKEMGLKEAIPGTGDHKFVIKYRLVIIYATKSE